MRAEVNKMASLSRSRKIDPEPGWINIYHIIKLYTTAIYVARNGAIDLTVSGNFSRNNLTEIPRYSYTGSGVAC